MKNNSKIGIYYPGFTRKAITFSIDDGDIPNDVKFLEIVRPAGILGTFNISSLLKKSLTVSPGRAGGTDRIKDWKRYV